ncbi:MAG: hypothetical protein Q6358_13665 [Candidatus Brocadiales bacterium]|nr:hypothetical protein [Candidatus Brocadiales bacterium]
MEDDIQKYIRCMEEIKLRYEVIDNHLNGKLSTGQPMTDMELICLQFRKVAELIMLSALCAHKTTYQIIHRNIEKEWEARKIRKTLDSIYQDFYPIPFDIVFDANTKKERNQRITDGFLSKDKCISLIGKCGGILHGFNPYNDKKIFKEVENVKNSFSEWQQKIRRLLVTHEIKLFGTDKQLWVYMAYGPKNQVFVEERVPIKSDRLVDF